MKATNRGLFILGLLVLSGQVYGQYDVSLQVDSAGMQQYSPLTTQTDAEINERLDHLVQQVQHNERAASTWWGTWIGIYAGATVGQGLVAYLSPDKSTRQDMLLGAGTTLLGMVGQLIAPVKSGYNVRQFDQRSNLDRSGRLELLTQAEALLAFQASKARSGRSWQTQVLNGTVNLTSGLITWLGFKRSIGEGVANFALNTVVSELQIYSQPVRAIKDYKDCVSNNQHTFNVQAFVFPGEVGLVMNF